MAAKKISAKDTDQIQVKWYTGLVLFIQLSIKNEVTVSIASRSMTV